MMRFLVTAFYFNAMVGNAHAMNWEGHDDWMAGLPAAVELRAIEGPQPAAPPAKRKKCLAPNEIGQVSANPYENALPLCNERRQPVRQVE